MITKKRTYTEVGLFFLYSNVNEPHRGHPPSAYTRYPRGDIVAQLYTRDLRAHEGAPLPFVDNL